MDLRKSADDALRIWYGFADDRGLWLAAALAYQGLFALIPGLALAFVGAQLFFGDYRAAQELQLLLTSALGPQLGDSVNSLLAEVLRSRLSTATSALGVIVLVWALGSGLIRLGDALDIMWHVRVRPDLAWHRWLYVQGRRIVLVLLPATLIAALSLASSVVQSALDMLGFRTASGFIDVLGSPTGILLAAFVSVSVLYRFAPNVRNRMRNVLVPSLVAVGVWMLGTYLLGMYVTHFGTRSFSGALGTVFLLLVWMNYTATILLLGAWISRWRAERHGTVEPHWFAESIDPALRPPADGTGTPS